MHAIRSPLVIIFKYLLSSSLLVMSVQLCGLLFSISLPATRCDYKTPFIKTLRDNEKILTLPHKAEVEAILRGNNDPLYTHHQ